MRPTLITLTLAVPTASYGLGLGDIHVESALHQPLVAQIELVGVEGDGLARVTAALASEELFEKFNLERPAFLSGTKLTVGRDGQGRPVLNMRSTESFTEPVVTLLVNLHSPSGELVREYTLLLDPAGLTTNTGGAWGTAAAANTGAAGGTVSATNTPVSSNAGPARTAVGYARLGQTHTVANHETLAHIAAATGARTISERHRMMIAIYRANPAAFQNNFNRMHAGVTLTFPTAEQLAAISVADSNREYAAQMAQWHAPVNRKPASVTTGAANGNDILSTDPAVLKQRIASLEQSLAQVRQELAKPLPVPAPPSTTAANAPATTSTVTAATTPATSARAAPTSAPTTGQPAARVIGPASTRRLAAEAVTKAQTSQDSDEDAPPAKTPGLEWAAIGIGAGLFFFAGAWYYRRRRDSHALTPTPRSPTAAVEVNSKAAGSVSESNYTVEFSTPPPPEPQTTAKVGATAAAQQPQTPKTSSESSWFEESFSMPIGDLLNDPTASIAVEDTEHTDDDKRVA